MMLTMPVRLESGLHVGEGREKLDMVQGERILTLSINLLKIALPSNVSQLPFLE